MIKKLVAFGFFGALLLQSCNQKDELNPPKTNPSTNFSLTKTQSTSLKLIYDLANEKLVEGDSEKALLYIEEFIKEAEKNEDKKARAFGYYLKGYIYDQLLAENGKAIKEYYWSWQLQKELNNTTEINKCLLGIAGIYYELQDFTSALQYYENTLENAENANNKIDQAVAYRSMAICYRELNENVDHIILFFDKALQIRKELHDEIGIADCYNGMAATYYDVNKDYQYAKIYYLKALDILKGKDNHQLANVYFNLGLIYKELKENKTALSYFSQSLTIAKKINYSKIHAQSRQEMGMIYLKNKDYIGAIAELKEAEEVAKKANDLILLEEINQLLSLCYKETGDINKALSYSEQTLQIRSMNAKNELIAVINQKEQLNEVNRFEASFKQNPSFLISWQWILLGSLVLIGIVSFLIWGVRSKRERELLTIIEENEERIDDLKYTLMDAAKHMLYQSDELNKLKDIHNNLIDQLNKRNGDDTWMINHINPN